MNDDDRGFWTNERDQVLNQPLDMKLTKQRDAFEGGKRKVTFLEGHTVIAQLNRVFGFSGWTYTVDQHGLDENCQGPVEEWYACFWAMVTLRVGFDVVRQDVGTAEVQNTRRTDRNTGEVSIRNNVRSVDARSMARKAAVTDGLKRAARTFGQQFGNSLYDEDNDVYAWMAAHPAVDSAETSKLRAEASRLLQQDQIASAKMPKPVAELSVDELNRCVNWLRARAEKAVSTDAATGETSSAHPEPDKHEVAVDQAQAEDGIEPLFDSADESAGEVEEAVDNAALVAKFTARIKAARDVDGINKTLDEANEARKSTVISQTDYQSLLNEAKTQIIAMPSDIGRGLKQQQVRR